LSANLPASPSLQEIIETQEYFKLPTPVLVEKDWYVVRALASINAVEVQPFRLIFGGGTCLSRAHKLIQRMSEDIDLKIICKEKPRRADLRRLRNSITEALLKAGFQFDPENEEHRQSANESRHTLYRLPYNSKLKGLRPEIKIETAVWPMRLSPVSCSVSSFWAEAFQKPPEVPSIPCAALNEAIAEKFVALTRRYGECKITNVPDNTLVRHVYDLFVTRSHYDRSEVCRLIGELMLQDAEEHGNKFPAYKQNPLDETLRSVSGLTTDDIAVANYSDFLREMVYGEKPDFPTAVAVLSVLADGLQARIA